MKHSHIVLSFLIPSNQNAPEAIEPTMCALDYPATSFGTCFGLELRLLTPMANRGSELEFLSQFSNLGIVIALIQTQALRVLGRRAGPVHVNILQGLACQLAVVTVGFGDGHGQRDALRIGEQAALGAAFGPICRVWPGFFPLPREPWSSRHPSLSIASRCFATHRRPEVQIARIARKPRLEPTPGNADAPPSACRLSTDSKIESFDC